MTKPKTYIQVNIYDRTILDLEREGIELKSMLSGIGCPKVWIVEGSLCEDVGVNNEDVEEEKEETIVVDDDEFVNPEILKENLVEKENDSETKFAPLPVLSNTIANVKIPRCSTKVVSLKEPRDSCFTFNMTEKISRIDSKHASNDDFDASEGIYEVENVLSELVQKVVDTENEPPNRVPLPTFSMTVGETRIPRSSTPISSQTQLSRKFTLNIPEMLSDIESMDEDGSITEMQTEDDEEATVEVVEENDITKTPSVENRASRMSCSLRETGSRGRSQDFNESANEFEESRLPRRRLSIKRSLSVISFAQSEACEEAGPEAKRILRPIKLEEVPEQEIDYDNNMNHPPTADALEPIRQPSERVYHELRTVKSAEYADTYAFHSAESSFDLRGLKREEIQYAAMHIEDYGGDDYTDYGGNEREETMLIDHYEEVGGNETEVRVDDMEREEDEEVDGDENQDDDGDEKVDNALATKSVSFAKPLTPSANAKKAEMDKLHIIKCYFDGCSTSYKWRKKHGKIRLVDHALTHIPNVEMKCELCDHTCRGIRTIRYHHKHSHPGEVLNGFGIRNTIWDKCFKQNIVIRGAGNLLQFDRQDKGVKRPRHSQDLNPATHIPSTSANDPNESLIEEKPKFHFFRIR